MLTSAHFLILAIAFVISVFLGILLRIVYNSNTVKDIPSRLKSIFVLTLAFPIIAYGELTKHKKDFIKEINQDNNLSTKQKHRLIRRLSSNSRVLSFVVLSSIRRFKPLLDTHVK